jgi:hypothetical protein
MWRQHTAAYRDELEFIVFNRRYKPDARVKAIKECLERGWGKSTAKVEHSGPEGAPIPVQESNPVLTSGERRQEMSELLATARKRLAEKKALGPAGADGTGGTQ